MDPEQLKLVEQWVAKKDAEYAAQGFPEDRRRQWADYNRQRYAQHLSQAQTQQPQLTHEAPHLLQQVMERFRLRDPRAAEALVQSVMPQPTPVKWSRGMSAIGRQGSNMINAYPSPGNR